MRQFCLTCTFVKLKYQNLKIPEDDKKVVIDQMCQVDPLFGASSWFMPDEMFHRNASKFAILLDYDI